MTKKRFIRRPNTGRITASKSAQMNRARWAAVRAQQDAEESERILELAEIEAQNLPRNQGDPLGSLQWHDFRTGRVRRWVIRIGARADQVTMSAPDGRETASHGWTWMLTKLRKHILSQN